MSPESKKSRSLPSALRNADVGDLRVFAAVARSGAITRAAGVLHRVPSNVSVRIKELESGLGCLLFSRHARGVTLTTKGRVLLPYAERVLALLDEAGDALRERAPLNCLRLGAMDSTAAIRIPALVLRLRESHPGLAVSVATATPQALVNALQRKCFDAVLVAEDDYAVSGDVRSRHAFTENLLLIGPARHARIRRAREVAASPIVVFEKSCPHRRMLEARLRRDGLLPSEVIEVGSYSALLSCVGQGLGFALVPEKLLQVHHATTAVSRHSVGPLRAMRIALMWRDDVNDTGLSALIGAIDQ